PDDWSLTREADADSWTVTLQSPGTGFAVIRLDHDMPDIGEVAQIALEALKQEYPTLEAEAAVDMLAGEMAVGHDMQFFALDFAATCWTRSFYGAAGTVLVMCQVSDIDQDNHEPALRALCASMRTETE